MCLCLGDPPMGVFDIGWMDSAYRIFAGWIVASRLHFNLSKWWHIDKIWQISPTQSEICRSAILCVTDYPYDDWSVNHSMTSPDDAMVTYVTWMGKSLDPAGIPSNGTRGSGLFVGYIKMVGSFWIQKPIFPLVNLWTPRIFLDFAKKRQRPKEKIIGSQASQVWTPKDVRRQVGFWGRAGGMGVPNLSSNKPVGFCWGLNKIPFNLTNQWENWT